MSLIVGVDLAWSGRKPTGLCVLDWDGTRLECVHLCAATISPEGLFSWLQTLGPNVVAAIDAPLLVGDHRRAEAEMAHSYAGSGLYAYSARWDFLSRHRITGGPEVGALLSASGWNLDPKALAGRGRHAVEVFPHAVAVALLGPRRMFRYKKGARARRLPEFKSFQLALCEFAADDCGLAEASHLMARLGTPASGLVGRALKAHEDELDAIACALAAFHFIRSGSEGMQLFGDATEGYIAVPVATSARARSCP